MFLVTNLFNDFNLIKMFVIIDLNKNINLNKSFFLIKFKTFQNNHPSILNDKIMITENDKLA